MTIFSSKTAFLVAIFLISYACAEEETEEGMDYGADVVSQIYVTNEHERRSFELLLLLI